VNTHHVEFPGSFRVFSPPEEKNGSVDFLGRVTAVTALFAKIPDNLF